MTEARRATDKDETVAGSSRGESGRPVSVRALRWLVIRFFKVVDFTIRLFGAIYYGIKTVMVPLFRFFVWPYPIFFRRHK